MSDLAPIFPLIFQNNTQNPTFDSLEVLGDATIHGTLTVKELHITEVSRSVLYESGSTKFGDTSDDVHEFTGSVYISGSINNQDGYDIERTIEGMYVTTATSFLQTYEMSGKIVEVNNSAPINITLGNLPKYGVTTFILRTTNAITFIPSSGMIKSDNNKTKLTTKDCSVTAWWNGTDYSLIGKLST